MSILLICSACSGKGYNECSCICNDCNGTGRFCCSQCSGKSHVKCIACQGTGKSAFIFKCKMCKGVGQLYCQTCNGKGDVNCPTCLGCLHQKNCLICQGSGRISCKTCKGKGKLLNNEINTWSVERLKFEYDKKKQEVIDQKYYAETKYKECVEEDLPQCNYSDFINKEFNKAKNLEAELNEIEKVLRDKL